MIANPQLNAISLAIVWAAVIMGMFLGAQVGYHAVDAENATIEYDAATQDVTLGSYTTNLNQCDADAPSEVAPSQSGIDITEHDPLIPLSERGEAWANTTDSLGEPEPERDPCASEETEFEDVVPAGVGGAAEETATAVGNATLNMAFGFTAMVGDYTAGVVFEHREDVRWQTVQAIVFAIGFAPFVVGGYLAYRRVRG